jgi:hypothetical protein
VWLIELPLTQAIRRIIVCTRRSLLRRAMSKEKKSNKEVKKPKAQSDETKKQKKDPKRYD